MQYNFFKEQDWSGNGSWYYIWQQSVDFMFCILLLRLIDEQSRNERRDHCGMSADPQAPLLLLLRAHTLYDSWKQRPQLRI
jgi:hypothetical protein